MKISTRQHVDIHISRSEDVRITGMHASFERTVVANLIEIEGTHSYVTGHPVLVDGTVLAETVRVLVAAEELPDVVLKELALFSLEKS